MKFGIVKWPKVEVSKPGDDRRKADAQRKRDGVKQSKTTKKKKKQLNVVITDETEEIFEVEDLDLGVSLSNTTQAIPVMMATTPSLSASPIVPLTIAASSSQSAVVQVMDEPTATPEASIPLPFTAPQSRISGDTSLLIWYADLVAIDRLISNSSLPRVALEAYRSEARAARLREKNDAEMVVATVQDRRAFWEGLLVTLDASIELEREWLGGGQHSESVAGDHNG
jgi:hypothetical protein